MTPYQIGQVGGLILLIASVVAGWRGIPFKWTALVAAGLLAAGLIIGGELSVLLIGILALLFWYGVARGLKHLFGGGEGYAR